MDELWNYNVELKQLKVVDDHGNILSNRLATVEPETGRVIGIVTPRFKLIQNKTLYDVMQQVGERLGLKLNTVHVCRNKALTSFRYGFAKQEVAVESGEKDDVVRFGVDVINTFDGGLFSKRIQFTADRLACLNGMTLPREIGRISLNNLSVDEGSFARVVEGRIKPVLETAHVWNEWAKFTPNRLKVGEFISKKLPSKVSADLLNRFDAGRDRTLWGLYNLVTFYATHELKTRTPENLRLRQMELASVENSFYNTDFK